MKIKDFFTGYKGKDIPTELNEFNWAAFLLTFIWGIKHKAWVTLLAIPLIWFQMPLGLNWLLLFIFQLYCGFMGNKWAYQVDWWMSPKDFRKTQALWSICAICLNIFLPILILGIIIRFVQKSENNVVDFITNSQCTMAYNKLKNNFIKVPLYPYSRTEQISQDFSKLFKNAYYKEPNVYFTSSVENENIDIYIINFNLNANTKDCNLDKKNCFAVSKFVLPERAEFPSHCKIYFDYKKNLKPDEQTQQSINKGYNLFKYL